MLTTITPGTIIEVPEGQAVYAVHTPKGDVFVIAANPAHATAAALRAEIPVMGTTLAR